MQADRAPAASFKEILEDRSGATAIEFALIAPLLFLLLFSIIEAGRLVFVHAALQASVADAARCASIDPSGCSTDKALAAEIERGMTALALSTSFSPEMLAIRSEACGLMLSASLPYQPIILTIAEFHPVLSAEACARQ